MTDFSIEKLQKKLIIFANKNKEDHHKNYDEIDYLNTWLSNLGNFNLKKKFFEISTWENLKSLFFLFYKKNISQNYKFYENINHNSKLRKQYQNLIISFKSNNTDFDTHFSSKRKNSKNSLWFLINLTDNDLIEKSNNIIISKKKIQNLFLIKIKTIFLFIFWFFLSKKNHYEKNFFDTLSSAMDKVDLAHVKKVFFPYEAQPYQKYLINFIKEKNPKCQIVAYCHGGLPSVPIEYVHHRLIDKIYVHSKTEKQILNNFFGWKKSKIFVSKSFRHIDKKKINSNKFYLPYSFNYDYKLEKNLNFLSQEYDLSSIKIVSHPFSKNTINQKKLIDYFNKIKKISSKSRKNRDKLAIFLGVTGSILEALQNKLTVIHVTNNPHFELYSNLLWKNIKIKKISKRIFVYKLKRKHNLIQYSSVNYFIKKHRL